MANKIEHWLESIGLGKYTDVFAENEITFEALPHLTEHDLRELGLPVGPRRIIAAAVAKLPHPASQRDAAPPGESSGQRTEAERRHLTVLFCDLVGSTELSTKLDPEDMRDLLRAYQDACTRVISRFDGYVAKFMGDGVYAYFGYPRAHEDDAERAIHAAVGLVAAVQQLDSKMTDLAVRVGIATGPVVVGDLLGQGASQEAAVTGETPNLAGRLQSLAAPNAIVISDTTYRLAGGTFECANRGKHALKGFAEPVQTWSVIRPRPVESRFDATRSSGITELIGRNEEVEILLRRWQRAKAGQGQVVLITGEPGIGKSRLVRVLQDGIAGEPHTRLFFQCSPYHTGSALHPVIEQLQRAAQFEAADEAPTKLRKLETVLGLAGHNDPQTAALFASLLSVPTADRYPALALSPPQLKQRTLDALIQQLVGLAERQPVLFVFEDAHWIDPTSMELLERMLARLEGLPVLAVITYRPEFTAPWGGGAQVTLLTLNRLSREDRTAMAERVAGGAQLPMEVLDQIASRTDGVPLFVEELTKTILESGLLIDAGDRYVLRGPLPPLAIPSTLHASLLARLDRLAAVKDVAQTAAAIGRQFSYSLIAAVAGIPEQDLRAALAQLVAAELVFQRGLAPDAKYLFKHALVQDAAYASLVRSRRQQLHAQIARALEEQFPDVVASEPEVLAHHFTAAGLTERAVHYWQRAGQQASDRSAYLEATKHFNTGIELLKTLPDTPARNQQELALHIALGAALIVTKGHASVEVERAYLKARELCHGMGDTSELVPILFGLWRCYVARPQLRTARELG
jgi:class 3 adenylate cyclase